MAAPTKYNQMTHAAITLLARLGYSNKRIAEIVGIGERAIYRWQREHEPFAIDMRKAKDIACDLVEAALFKRATGYEHKEVKVFYDKDKGECIEHEVIKHHPPDVAAAKFMLQNMRPKDWKEKVEVDLIINNLTDWLHSEEPKDVTPEKKQLEGDSEE